MKLIAAAILIILAILGYLLFVQSPQEAAEMERFIASRDTNTSDVIQKLASDGFISSAPLFRLALLLRGRGNIKPGGYRISKAMSAWQIASVLAGEPYMKWVTIPEGLRKEEIADMLADALGWSREAQEGWVSEDTAYDPDYIEGVYFPDTYLISVEEAPADVAKRLRAKFEEAFQPYAKEAIEQDIRWTTLLKIASLVQREAASKEDMPLIAGILWNRLLSDAKLDIDATVQYARDTKLWDSVPRAEESGLPRASDEQSEEQVEWWAPTSVGDQQIDSPYNTYLYKGLPPHPIANPGLEAIRAVLHPEKTECLYYLHDGSGAIHCAETYEEHLENIETYLK